MKIFRVEHPENHIGPYVNRKSQTGDSSSVIKDPFHQELLQLMAEEHNLDWSNHPGPIGDYSLLGRFTTSHVFGFISMESLQTWFGNWLDLLLQIGFVVVEYESGDVVVGKHQVAFIP